MIDRVGCSPRPRFRPRALAYAQLIGWLRRHGELDRVGVESAGAYAAGLVRALTAEGIPVLEVNQPHRHARQRLGKSDPIDAELAARAALSGTAKAVPKQTSGIVEAIRQLNVAEAAPSRRARPPCSSSTTS